MPAKKAVLVAAVDVAADDGYAAAMMSVVLSVLLTLRAWAYSRTALQLEILALRHQLQVLERSRPRVRLEKSDRWLWVLLSRIWTGWNRARDRQA